jgi:hypothetical protein
MPGKSANGMSPCACSLSEKNKKEFPKKRASLEKIKKTPPEKVSAAS